MYELIKKPEKKKTGVLNNSVQQNKKNRLQNFGFTDNNKVNIIQNKIQENINNTGLPDNLKSGIENLSGLTMDDVRVHYNSPKPKQIQAHAYTQGANIYVASGQEKHLPHEAWHAAQQKQGRVKPTTQMNGVNINDSPKLETEADKMGERALNYR